MSRVNLQVRSRPAFARVVLFVMNVGLGLALSGAALVLSPLSARAQVLTGLARATADGTELRDAGDTLEVEIGLSQPVPFRIFSLVDPLRLVIDFNEVDWSAVRGDDLDRSQRVVQVRTGTFRPGWSRMVVTLDAPMNLQVAELKTFPDQTARMIARFVPVTREAFAARAGAPPDSQFDIAAHRALTAQDAPAGSEAGPLVVVLDPGHGGVDPGAEVGGVVEADLMLTFARELRELLLRTGEIRAVLTRDSDVFVPLEARVSIARAAGADVFLSLHADTVLEGRASGATIYTLSDRASDAAAQKLAERHDRADLLAGLDLSSHDDVIATVLMDMARVDTAHRTDRLADALVEGLTETVGMHKRPHLEAGFSVLKAADIPSVLIELGFLSSPRDLARLQDPAWRARAAQGVRDALLQWAQSDAAESKLLRQ